LVALIKADKFWVRKNARNDEVSHIALDKLRPVRQLGGMAYGRLTETFEIPRRSWSDQVQGSGLSARLHKKNAESQMTKVTKEGIES
ncbi:hypothetical protein BDW02DRAFT_513311, partial [Decorospora gaudefroyi]